MGVCSVVGAAVVGLVVSVVPNVEAEHPAEGAVAVSGGLAGQLTFSVSPEGVLEDLHMVVPVRSEGKVVVEAFVSKEKLFVAPQRRHGLRLGNDVSNEGLVAAKADGLVVGVHVEQLNVGLDQLELLLEVLNPFLGECVSDRILEQQLEGPHGASNRVAILVKLGDLHDGSVAQVA